MEQRNYKIDNIKAILIFLVVFGHILELVSTKHIYRVIYSFHMPAFIFITGHYAKFRPQKILLELIMPYFLFQTLYLFFDGYMTGISVALQYTKPYWFVWYLMTMTIYYLLLPAVKTGNTKQRLIIVILSIAVSLLAGYDDSIGYYMSLSRTLVFFPFFILGNYIEENQIHNIIFKKWYAKAAVLLGVVISSYYIFAAHISTAMLYGSYSYARPGFGVQKRAVILIIAGIWILALFNFVPNIKIPVFTELGKGTFSVLLVHGFIQRWLWKYGIFNHGGLRRKLILAVAVSALIVLFFGNRYFSKAFDYIVRGRMIKEKKDMKHEKIAVNMERAS